MLLLFFLIAFLFLSFDVSLLKRRSPEVFLATFRVPSWAGMICAVLAVAVLLSGRWEEPLLGLAVVFVGLYALRRRKYKELLAAEEAVSGAAVSDELRLALDTFDIILTWVAGMIAVSVAVNITEEFFNPFKSELAILVMVAEFGVVLMTVLIYEAVRRYPRLKFRTAVGLEPKGLGAFKLWIFPFFLAVSFAAGAAAILSARLAPPVTPLGGLLEETTSVGVLIFFVATAIFSAPFFEEIIFRGFFFYVVREFKGAFFAVIFIGLAFGSFHIEQYWGDWTAIGIVAAFGFMLTILRAWTGSVIPGMVAHYTYNTSLVVLPVIILMVSNPVFLRYQLEYAKLNFEGRERLLLQSIQGYPGHADSYNALAWLYAEEEKSLERALGLVDRALVMDPDNSAYLDTKAEVLYKMGRCEEALAIAAELVAKYPADSYLKGQWEKFKTAGSRHES